MEIPISLPPDRGENVIAIYDDDTRMVMIIQGSVQIDKPSKSAHGPGDSFLYGDPERPPWGDHQVWDKLIEATYEVIILRS